MSTPYTVIVILEAKPEHQQALKSALLKVVTPSRAEPHNITYKLHQSHENPNQFILYETWQSKELHQTQFTKPYIVELGQKLEPLLAQSYQVYFCEEVPTS